MIAGIEIKNTFSPSVRNEMNEYYDTCFYFVILDKQYLDKTNQSFGVGANTSIRRIKCT